MSSKKKPISKPKQKTMGLPSLTANQKQIIEDAFHALIQEMDDGLHLGEIEQSEYNEDLKDIFETAKLFGIKKTTLGFILTLDEENAKPSH